MVFLMAERQCASSIHASLLGCLPLWQRFRHRKRERRTRVPSPPGLQYRSAGIPLAHVGDASLTDTYLSPLDGHHDLLFCSVEVGKDEYMGPNEVHRTHLVLNIYYLPLRVRCVAWLLTFQASFGYNVYWQGEGIGRPVLWVFV
jgi:hypothetical protein